MSLCVYESMTSSHGSTTTIKTFIKAASHLKDERPSFNPTTLPIQTAPSTPLLINEIKNAFISDQNAPETVEGILLYHGIPTRAESSKQIMSGVF